MAFGAKTVEIIITGNAKQAIAEIEKLGATVEGESTSMGSKLQALAGPALLAVGVAAAAAGVAAIKMADDFEESHARLVGALRNAHQNWQDFADSVGKVDKKLENLGFTNTQTEGALAVLTRAAGSAEKAIALMGLAANLIARYIERFRRSGEDERRDVRRSDGSPLREVERHRDQDRS